MDQVFEIRIAAAQPVRVTSYFLKDGDIRSFSSDSLYLKAGDMSILTISPVEME
jgi:hypothetical protein